MMLTKYMHSGWVGLTAKERWLTPSRAWKKRLLGEKISLKDHGSNALKVELHVYFVKPQMK